MAEQISKANRFWPGPALIVSSFVALLGLLIACRQDPLTDLDRVLAASWRSYVQTFITPEGRVAVPDQNGGTISEAQAYALLRAVWAGDEATFTRVHAWTLSNLCRSGRAGDHLLSWSWGRKTDGSMGVLDANTATDGDLDYALALALASRRGWRPPPDLPDYLEEARQVMEAVLIKETVQLSNGELLLTPGDWHEAGPPYLVNPSYFSPGAYRIFIQIQPDPRWMALHQSAYRLLSDMNQGLGGEPGTGLFPDWCRVDGEGRAWPAPGRGTDFGWEAVRLPWRLALDQQWFGESWAAKLLKRQFLPFFQQEWQARGRLAAVYHQSGAAAVDFESPVLYAGVLAAALACEDRDFAGRMARQIMSFYHEKDGRAYFVSPDNYYANNWAWLGLALYAGWVKDFQTR